MGESSTCLSFAPQVISGRYMCVLGDIYMSLAFHLIELCSSGSFGLVKVCVWVYMIVCGLFLWFVRV